MPDLDIDGIGTVSIPDDQWGKLDQSGRDEVVRSIVSAHHPDAPAQASPDTPQASPGTANVLQGMRQTAEETVGGAANLLANAREAVQARLPGGWGGTGPDTLVDAGRAVGKGLTDDANSIDYQHGSYGQSYRDGGVPGVVGHFAKEALVNAPHLAAALNPATLAVDMAGQTELNAEDRARNDGRGAPGGSDYLAGGLAAAAQEAMGRVGAGAALGRTTGSLIARLAKAPVVDAATGAAGSEAQYLGTHAGTAQGTDPQAALDAAVEGGGAGAVGGAYFRGSRELPNVVKAASDAKEAAKGGRLLDATPEQAASNLRVADIYDHYKGAAEKAQTDGLVPQESNYFKTAAGDISKSLVGAVDDLRRAGEIGRDAHQDLVGGRGSVLDNAMRHNRAFGASQLDRIDRLDVGDSVKTALKDGFRDLNTTVYNSMFKNGEGRFEKLASKVDNPIATRTAAGLGFYTGHPVVGAAILGASGGIRALGRGLDNLTGNRTPPAMQDLRAVRLAAAKRGIAAGDTFRALDRVSADARQQTRALGDFAQAANQEAQLQRLRDRAGKTSQKVTERQQAEEDRSRLMAAVPAGAAPSGGHINEVADWFRRHGYDATPGHVVQAIDLLHAHGGFRDDRQYQSARQGYQFPGKTLVPLFQTTRHVLDAAGVVPSRDVASSAKAEDLATARLAKRKADAAVPPLPQVAPQSPVGAIPGPSAPAQAPVAPASPKATRTAPTGPRKPVQRSLPFPRAAKASPGGDYPAPENAKGIDNVISYKSTVQNAKAAQKVAEDSAPSEGLKGLPAEVERRTSKKARMQAVEEAAKSHKDDPEAVRWIMGPLRTLAQIGGEKTAEEKAVARVRARKSAS